MLRMQDLVDENDSSDADDTQVEESSPEAQQPLFSPLADRASVASAAAQAEPSDPNMPPPDDQEAPGLQRQARRRRSTAAAGERKRKAVGERDPYSHNADECLDNFSNNETSTGTLSQTGSSSSQLRESAAASDHSYRSSTSALDHADVRRRHQLKEASKRCRKRQKDESMVFSTEINTLHQKLALLHTKFNTPGLPSTEENRSTGHHRFRMKRLVAFLEKKLSDHKRWLRSVRSLMVSAPLFDFAATLAKDGSDSHSTTIPDLKYLDEWREVSEHEKFSRVLMTQRIEDAVRSSSKNAADLLMEFANRGSQFQWRHSSRGWNIGTTSNNSLLAFHCERQLPIGTSAKDIAFKLWHSVQRDDILRTFVPIVQESTIAHGSEFCSITRRLLQPNPNAQHQPIVTVESIAVAEESGSGQTHEEAWQISIEVIDDHYLCLLAADKADDAPPQSPHAQASSASSQPLDDGSSNSDSSKAGGRFTIASRILQTVSGASVELAGCTQHEDSPSDDSASLELLQYFVTMLPVYEELHLFQSGTL